MALIDKYDKFTKRARKVLTLAQEEARRLNHHYVGTEHLLLGLIREGEGLGAKALAELGVRLPDVYAAVEAEIGRGDRIVLGDIGLTPRAKKVIELAVEEAQRLNHHYVGTEHLLLGLVREGEGIAARVLESLGVTLEGARTMTVRLLAQAGARPPELPDQSAGPKNNVVACRIDARDLAAIDALIEAGVRTTRSDAAAWLISAGIAANRALFDQVRGTVAEIRRLRGVAQSTAQRLMAAGDTDPTEDESDARSGE